VSIYGDGGSIFKKFCIRSISRQLSEREEESMRRILSVKGKDKLYHDFKVPEDFCGDQELTHFTSSQLHTCLTN
jgi:hypothetical protein